MGPLYNNNSPSFQSHVCPGGEFFFKVGQPNINPPQKSKKSSSKKPSPHPNLTIKKKKTMLPHITDWKRSSRIEIQSITLAGKSETAYHGIGWENQQSKATNNMVCLKPTGKGFAGGHLVSVPMSDVTISPNPKIEQPWYHDEVMCLDNTLVSQTFDKILSQTLNGVTPQATYLDVMTFVIGKGIPVFIVGGAVRDVLYAVLVNQETDANAIKSKIKDIDIGFGCSPNEFFQIVSSKYTGVVPPGPRGLVTIGRADASGLFLEGKAINGLNNDNHSIKKEIPKCYGCNLRGENICRDFACNAMWYDPKNRCVIDTCSGKGVGDTVNRTLRIPVEKNLWDFWMMGNPSKLMRFYKFIAKGYNADSDTRDFIINKAASGKYSGNDVEGKNMLRKSPNERQIMERELRKDLATKAPNLLQEIGL